VIKKSMGFTVDPESLMNKSGREVAEEMFDSHGIDCRITNLRADGSDGGGLCFIAEVEMDAANAKEWKAAFE